MRLDAGIIRMKYWFRFIGFIVITALTAGCDNLEKNNGGNNNVTPGGSEKNVTLNFFNESSYRVILYKDLNPENHDPAAIYLTVDAGETATIRDYPSSDTLTGNGFYPRYLVLLADRITTGTVDIHAPAERNLADIDHISFVLEAGQSYTKTIRQPGTLVFINAYLKLYNSGSQAMQLREATTPLKRLDADAGNQGFYIQPGQTGYFELEIPYYSSDKVYSAFKIFDNNIFSFPSFTAEKGKLYSYTWNGSSVSGGSTDNIAY